MFMHEMMVSAVNMPKLLAGILEIWGSVAGFQMAGAPPSRGFAQNAMKVGSLLAQHHMVTTIMAQAAQKV